MEQWSSRVGFLAATAGAAIGPTTVWSFPIVAGQNGGGAYLVPYLLATFVLAVPFMAFELSLGRALRSDVVSAFESVRPEFEAIGWIVTGAALLVASYYLVLTGWALAFFVVTVVGADLSFGRFVGTSWPVLSFAVVTAITGSVVALGVRDGIERLATVAVPAIVVSLLALVAYATTLSGFDAGLSFFLAPDLSALREPLVWAAAVGHAFLSLSVGRGVVLTYGQYLDEATDAVSASLLVTVVTVGVGILAGLAVCPVVFTAGGEPTSGVELAFAVLPRTLTATAFGTVATAAFFGVLLLAGLSSSVALFEVGVSSVLSTVNRTRSTVAAELTAGVFLVGLLSALSYSAVNVQALGVPTLDLLDTTVGTFALPVTTVLIAAVFTWYRESLSVLAQITVPSVRVVLKYGVPSSLVAAIGIHLWYRSRFAAWHLLPNARRPDIAPETVSVAVVFAALFVVGALLVAYRARRRATRRHS
jgi:NSS family neurotransmitter:Na+ symporter